MPLDAQENLAGDRAGNAKLPLACGAVRVHTVHVTVLEAVYTLFAPPNTFLTRFVGRSLFLFYSTYGFSLLTRGSPPLDLDDSDLNSKDGRQGDSRGMGHGHGSLPGGRICCPLRGTLCCSKATGGRTNLLR